MSERFLDHYDGVTEYFSKDGDKIIIRKEQDVAPILERNKNLRDIESGNWKGDMHHVASIPKIVLEDWWRELGSDPFHKSNRTWLIAKLNSRDWVKLRTKSGKI